MASRSVDATRADRWPNDPVAYATEYLRVAPWDAQREIARLMLTPPYRVAVRSGHKVGKSWCGAWLASWFYDSFDPSLTVITAPSADSIRDITFRTLRALRPSAAGFHPKASRLESSPAHFVEGLATNSGERFQGRHADRFLLVFDEAVGIDRVFFDVAASMFVPRPGHAWLAFYNPTDTSCAMYDEEQSGNWHVVTISQLDHPNIAAELRGFAPPYPSAVRLAQVKTNLAAYSETLPDDAPEHPDEITFDGVRYVPGPIADARILARWPRQGSASVWSEASYRATQQRQDVNPDWLVWIGCDVARYGDDDTAIVVRKGPAITYAETANGWPLSRTLRRLREVAYEWQTPSQRAADIPVMIDGGGMGAGLIDFADGLNAIEVNASRKPIDGKRFTNVRSELWLTSRECADAGALDLTRLPGPLASRLRQELLAVRYTIRDGRVIVDAKDETKRKIKRSPDLADALNLACYGASLVT